jgi:secondary thiamine-phosphate synthase enzyme
VQIGSHSCEASWRNGFLALIGTSDLPTPHCNHEMELDGVGIMLRSSGNPRRSSRRFDACSPAGSSSVRLMSLHSAELLLSTRGDADVVDLTDEVERVVAEAGVGAGQVLAFVRGSTAAVATMEFEPGGVHDLRTMLERLIPTHGEYEHNRLNHDSNSHAHQRATLVGPSETVPIVNGRLALGTWQQLVLVDFDDRPRQRRVVVQVLA